LEVVLAIDTSNSMRDRAEAICTGITAALVHLEVRGIDVTPVLLGISEDPGGNFGCLTDNVIHLFGTEVPGSPPPGNETLGDCPGGNELATEDWGRATAVVADAYAWLPDAIPVIVPLTDEGPWCGNPVTPLDQDSIDHAIRVAQDNGVIVSPMTEADSNASVVALAGQIAAFTGGTHVSWSPLAEDVASGLEQVLLDACRPVVDCNDNQVPDLCDIQDGTSSDVNSNGVPDECECSSNLAGDGDVDLHDFYVLQSCFTGAGPAGLGTCCRIFDIDSTDDDVDLNDYTTFSAIFTGP
jgi:hypothetical protein